LEKIRVNEEKTHIPAEEKRWSPTKREKNPAKKRGHAGSDSYELER